MKSTDRERLLEQLAQRPRPGVDQVQVLAEGPGSDAPVVVLVHPVGGGLLCYRDLARALAPDHRVLGIEARRNILEQHDGEHLAALAQTYVDALSMGEVHPSVICGWSHGGLVAWEMAQVLSGAPSCPSVVMIDTIWPLDPAEPLPPDAEIADWFTKDLARTNQLDPDDLSGMSDLAARLRLDDSLVEELSRLFVLNSRAFLRHSPTPGQSFLTLVAAEDTDSGRLDEMGTGDTAVVRVKDVDHYSLLFTEHGVAGVADAVRASVRHAR